MNHTQVGTASPSPSYTQTIYNTGDEGYINEVVANDNLAIPVAKTQGNCTTTINADGSVNISGRENGSFLYTNPIMINSGEKIYIKLVTNTIKPEGLLFNLWSNAKRNDAKANMNFNQVYEYTSNIDNDQLSPYFWSTGINVNFDFIIILSKNPITEDYPYRSQEINFPLASGQNFYEGDYLADDGLHHVMAQKEYTSTAIYGFDSSETNLNTVKIDKQNNDKKKGNVTRNETVLCNKAIYSTRPNGYNDENLIGKIYDGGNTMYLIGLPKTITSLEEAQNYIGNILLQYPLATEAIDPYTPEQQAVWNEIKALRTYKGGTHIDSSNNVEPTVTIKYVRDLETVINELSSAIVAQGGV